MADYVCKYMPRCESRMFTEGHVYPVERVEGNLEVVVDNLGFERYLLKGDPSFIVENHHWRGPIYRAQFERRES